MVPPNVSVYIFPFFQIAVEAAMDFALSKNVRLFMAPEAGEYQEISRDIKRTSRLAKIWRRNDRLHYDVQTCPDMSRLQLPPCHVAAFSSLDLVGLQRQQPMARWKSVKCSVPGLWQLASTGFNSEGSQIPGALLGEVPTTRKHKRMKQMKH